MSTHPAYDPDPQTDVPTSLFSTIERWMKTGQRVELGFASGDGAYGRGTIVSFAEQPTCVVRLDNGTEKSWVARLLRPTTASSRPAVVPGPPSGARGVRCLIDELIRSTAPKLGRTAVARIAGPLTEAVISLRDELQARPSDLRNAEDVQQTLSLLSTSELRDELIRRGVETLAEPVGPPQTGDLIHGGPSARERCPDGTALRGAGGALVLVRGDQGSRHLIITNEPVGDIWPARVLEVGGAS